MKVFYVFSIIGLSLLLLACSSGVRPSKNLSIYSYFYELYKEVNNLDSSTVDYIKNKYLIDLIVNASKNEQLGLYHQAIIDLLDAARFDSSKVILFALARNFYYIQKYTLALDYAFKAYSLDSNFIPNLKLLAKILIDLDKGQEALFFTQRLIDLVAENLNEEDISLHLDAMNIVDTNYKNAINFLSSIDNPKLKDFVNSKLLLYYFLKGDTQNIDNTIEKIFDSNEPKREVYPELVDFYLTNLLNKGEYEKAVTKLINLSKRLSLNAIFTLSDKFISNIKTIDSIDKRLTQKLTEFLSSFTSQSYIADYKILWICYLTGDSLKSIELCSKILSNEEIDLEILVNTSGILYYGLNKKEEAIRNFRTFRFKYMDEPVYHKTLGEYYLLNQQFKPAEEEFLKALSLDSLDSKSYSNLGWLHSEIEDWEKSDYYYQKSLELAPQDPMTLNNYAYSLIQRDTNLPYAGRLIENAIRMRPDDPNILDTYGWFFYKIGDFEKAKEYIEKSISVDSTNAVSFLHLGLIYKSLGDSEKYHYYFEKAIKMDPNNKEVLNEVKKQTK
jgi:tetratricopeptide (TPR) repeat protein